MIVIMKKASKADYALYFEAQPAHLSADLCNHHHHTIKSPVLREFYFSCLLFDAAPFKLVFSSKLPF